MLHFNTKILVLALWLFSCGAEQAVENQLLVSAPQVALRQEPHEKSPELASVHKGDIVVDLFEVGPTESQVATGELVFQTPWIKVRLQNGQVGWILAWALRPASKQADWLLQKRMLCYFGNALTKKRNQWVEAMGQAADERSLRDLWQEGTLLRDTFLQLVGQKPQGSYPLKYTWMEAALPGFLYQQVGEEGRPHLFADYSVWQRKSQATNGKADDAYFQVCIDIFPKDSIESFFPVWKFQLSETASASQLGTGQHLKILMEVDQVRTLSTLFQTQLDAIKAAILEDIFDKDVQYWQSKEKILSELEELLHSPPQCLSEGDIEALNIRKKMFEDPSANGIKVNLRSGE